MIHMSIKCQCQFNQRTRLNQTKCNTTEYAVDNSKLESGVCVCARLFLNVCDWRMTWKMPKIITNINENKNNNNHPRKHFYFFLSLSLSIPPCT